MISGGWEDDRVNDGVKQVKQVISVNFSRRRLEDDTVNSIVK